MIDLDGFWAFVILAVLKKNKVINSPWVVVSLPLWLPIIFGVSEGLK